MGTTAFRYDTDVPLSRTTINSGTKVDIIQNYINHMRTGGYASQNCRRPLYSKAHNEVGAALSSESGDGQTHKPVEDPKHYKRFIRSIAA